MLILVWKERGSLFEIFTSVRCCSPCPRLHLPLLSVAGLSVFAAFSQPFILFPFLSMTAGADLGFDVFMTLLLSHSMWLLGLICHQSS